MEGQSKEWEPYHGAGELQKLSAEDLSPEQLERARTLLVRMIDSGKHNHRQRGTKVFAHFAGPEHVSVLEKLADAPDKENKAWGPPLAALFRLAPERGRAILNKRCDEFNYRSAVKKPLVELPSEYEDEFWPMLFDSPQIARTLVIEVLGRIGTERSIPELQEVLRNVSAKELRHYKGRVEGAIGSIQQRAGTQ